MWFGDLVTPVWWDDLWLNESFAEYMGTRVTADVTEFGEAWVHDAHVRRQWGLRADQRPSTHPVAGNGALDAASALQDFDGISYAKGASIIKQLNTRLGDDVFLRGANDHFEKHRFGNATMADLLDAWDRAGAGDLTGFADSWLRTAGPDRIELDRAAGEVRRKALDGHPADRAHAFGIATADPDSPGQWRTESLLVDADSTAVDLPRGPVVLDPRVATWAVTLLDPETMASLPELLPATTDGLIRASIWNSVRNAFHLALLDPAEALAVLEAGIPVGGHRRWRRHDVGLGLLGGGARRRRPGCRPRTRSRRRRWLALPRVRRVRPSGSPRSTPRSLRAPTSLPCAGGWRVATSSPTAWRSTSTCAGGSWSGSPCSAPSTATSSQRRWPPSRPRCPRSSTPRRSPRCRTPRPRPGPGSVSPVRSSYPTTSWRPSAAASGGCGQHDVTEPYVARYFDELPATAQVRTRVDARRRRPRLLSAFGDRRRHRRAGPSPARPRPISTPMLRRSVIDETDDLERRLAVVKEFGAA